MILYDESVLEWTVVFWIERFIIKVTCLKFFWGIPGYNAFNDTVDGRICVLHATLIVKWFYNISFSVKNATNHNLIIKLFLFKTNKRDIFIFVLKKNIVWNASTNKYVEEQLINLTH